MRVLNEADPHDTSCLLRHSHTFKFGGSSSLPSSLPSSFPPSSPDPSPSPSPSPPASPSPKVESFLCQGVVLGVGAHGQQPRECHCIAPALRVTTPLPLPQGGSLSPFVLFDYSLCFPLICFKYYEEALEGNGKYPGNVLNVMLLYIAVPTDVLICCFS